jgi:hypothetical protein
VKRRAGASDLELWAWRVPVFDTARAHPAQPVVASHLRRPGQQAVGRAAVAALLAVHDEGDQVKRASAEPELT